MTRPATFAILLPDERLSAVELRAAALDGEVTAVGDGFLPLDAPLTAWERAASLAPALLDTRVVVAGRSAAWVWGWAAPPTAVATCVSISARIPSPDRRRLATREVVIDADEVRVIGGVPVTTPVRTLVDLARHDADDGVLDLLVAGILSHDVTAEALDAALSRRVNLAYVRLARRRLAAAVEHASSPEHRASQPLLTR